jgi:hypothetical protein
VAVTGRRGEADHEQRVPTLSLILLASDFLERDPGTALRLLLSFRFDHSSLLSTHRPRRGRAAAVLGSLRRLVLKRQENDCPLPLFRGTGLCDEHQIINDLS